MEKKKVMEICAVFVLFLLMAVYVERTDGKLESGNRIARQKAGKGDMAINLVLDVEDILENYSYPIDVQEIGITNAQAMEYFLLAEQEIERSFFAEGEHAERVTDKVCMKEHYADGLVRAEWSLDNYQIVDIDGSIIEDAVSKEGSLVQATAELSCGDYEEIYSFGFVVYPRELSVEEKILSTVQAELQKEQMRQGKDYLNLPAEAEGYELIWTEKEEHLVVKVLFFEILILVLLYFTVQERKRQKDKLRKEEMKLDYAEVVNKLLVLLGAGMSLTQAWNSIVMRYHQGRREKRQPVRYIYEEMLITSHQISDGESERIAYQKFGERTGVGEYYRLVRILVQNLQTGSRGLCRMLEQEGASALEERRALARKLGEEAGTKMLLPLVLMLGIVIAIIMVPAMHSFNV